MGAAVSPIGSIEAEMAVSVIQKLKTAEAANRGVL